MSILYALPEVAKSLGGISIWTLRKHISNGHLRTIRIGRRVFLDGAELERIQREGLPSLRVAPIGGHSLSDGDLSDGEG
jgi:hypothetical protein